jgi:SAM-dependent methyltransferase
VTHRVWVRGLLPWIEPKRLLGTGEWTLEGRSAHAELATHDAADLAARLRGLGIGGSALEVTVEPALPRAAVRAARTTDARRRRDTTPGFSRAGTRLDPEGKWSLTPEALAVAMGERAAGKSVVDAGCGAGGNTIGFARAGCRVVAIERDAARLADARHNARVYGVEDRVRWIHAEIEDALPTLSADVLFVDPPWGVEWSRTLTPLAALPALTTALGVRDRFGEVWAKVPPSFDVREVPDARPEAWYGTAAGDRRRVKFLLVRVKGAVA